MNEFANFSEIDREGITYVIARPDAKRTTKGLSKISYNFEKAIADLIDNSIAAHATKIDVILESRISGIYVHVMDNGEGMTRSQLPHAIRYGADDHQDDRRLNVYGFGMKTACQSISSKFRVISRTKSDPKSNMITFDQAVIDALNEFAFPIEAAPERFERVLNNFTGNQSGTLIMIEDADRFFNSEERLKDENRAKKFINSRIEVTKDHLRKVFQRFLDADDDRVPTIVISVNGIELQPWDPFCLKEPTVKVEAEHIFNGLMTNSGKTGTVIFRGYILPARHEFENQDLASDSQIGPQTHGVYVYRENRLIEMSTYFDPPLFRRDTHMNTLRIEFSYDGSLDELFNTGLQKASMNLGDLEDAIRKLMEPLVREATLRSRGKGRVRPDTDSHAASNKGIKNAEARIEQAKIEPVDSKKATVLSNYGSVILPIVSAFDDLPVNFVNPVPSIDDGHLWQLRFHNNKQVVDLNKGHEFYEKVYLPIQDNSIATRGLDYIFWALAVEEARCTIPEFKRQLEQFRFKVSMNLKELVESMPEPKNPDDD